MSKKDKYLVRIVIKEFGNYRIIKKLTIKPNTEQFKYSKAIFMVKTNYPTYSEGLKHYFYFDFNTGVQISFRKINRATYSKKFFNILLGDNVISALVSGLGKKAKPINYMTLLFGIALGGAFGYIIAGVI